MSRFVASLIVLTLISTASLSAEKPNFVFILVDDLGYMDIGAYNPDCFYETPNVDKLAATGMRFTNGYAANPVCSPTRYSIMSGRHPSRIDATNFFSGRRKGRLAPAPLTDAMPLEEQTIAETLKMAGYRTAFLGKWHLGPTEEFWPRAQGFDINIAGHRAGMGRSFFSPYRNPRITDGPEGEYLTERLADEATNIIQAFGDSPFLVYLSFYTVHTPLQAPLHLRRKYERKVAQLGLTDTLDFGEEEQVWPNAKERERRVRVVQKHTTYAAMVESMDAAVGRVLDKLEVLGITDNTVVCFMSDNGGLSTSEGLPTSNLPLRGGKGWIYEGGIREPFIIRWPGVTDRGSTCDVPVVSMDFYPTMLEIAGIDRLPAQHRDGESLVPLLRGGDSLPRESLYWHYPHYSNQGGFPGGAIREGDWKLIERFEDGRTHLYNLKDDIGERNDIAIVNRDRVASMRERLHAWYKDVDAKFLQPLREGDPTPWRPEQN